MIIDTSRFRAVLYDMDGTLLDTIADIAAAANAVLSRRGFPTYETAEYLARVGWGLAGLMERCVPPEQADAATIAACAADVKREYAANPVDRTRPYDGVVDLVTEVHRRGYLQAILSNKAHELTTIIAARTLPDVFEIVRGHVEGVAAKPSPEAALAICRELKLEPSQVLYVGDTAVDMETALNAGMTPVGVSWGFRDRSEVAEAGAAAIIDRPEELSELLPGVNVGEKREA